jgi:hypothetical protein
VSGRRGSSIVDALVGAALAGIAVAGLARTAAVASQGLRLARDTGTALALANERLETLRAGPRAEGEDYWTAPDGTVFTRSWTDGGGRGRAATLSTRVAWGARTLVLATEAMP